ncbi:MAG: branched-chain amino acid ABC transporter permease [Bacteroidetes bacterium]|nr:branched-chain amino acid ABC transporter permease [Bacteroidota bacterium]
MFFALYTCLANCSFFPLYNWISVTNGPFGINVIPKPEIFGFRFGSLGEFALLGGVITGITLIFFIAFHRTPLSRLFQGVRDDQLAMMTFGKKPGYYKSLAILISSGVSAVAGALFATYFSYIDPTSFTLNESILIISMVLIGGLGVSRFCGGCFVLCIASRSFPFYKYSDAVAANLRMMIYALILILLVMYRPHGFLVNTNLNKVETGFGTWTYQQILQRIESFGRCYLFIATRNNNIFIW